MMPLFGSTLGFLAPLALVGLPVAIGGLIYAYRKRGRANSFTVGSLFLLKTLPQKTRARKKFVPPLRFYFELLLLLLLVIGSTGLFLQGTGDHVAIVVDNSFHLRAHSGSGNDRKALFDSIKNDADTFIQALSSDAQIDLYVTAPHMEALGRGMTVRDAAKKLTEITTVFAAGEVQGGIQRLVSDTTLHRVGLFSDLRLRDSDKALFEKKLYSRSPRAESDVIQNISLSSASLNTGIEKGVEIELTSFATTDVKGILKLEGAEDIVWGGSTPLASIESRDVIVPKGKTLHVSFKQPPSSIKVFRASFTQSAGPQIDGIIDDNVGWIGSFIPSSDITLATKLSATQLELSRMKSFNFKIIDEDSFRKVESGDGTFDGPLIIHGISPKKLPSVSTLFIDPPLGNPVFAIKKRASQGTVTRWLSSHPALTYLNLPDLVMKEFSVMEPLPWTRDFLSTTKGPAALIGENKGERYAALGFDIFPFKGKESPTLSILTLNLIKWISNSSSHGTSFEPFTNIQLPLDVKRIQTVMGTPLSERRSIGENETLSVEEPTAIILQTGTEELRVLAVNFFNELESDTLRERTIALEKTDAEVEASAEVSSSLVKIFALLSLLLLVGDLTFGAIKRFSPERSAI